MLSYPTNSPLDAKRPIASLVILTVFVALMNSSLVHGDTGATKEWYEVVTSVERKKYILNQIYKPPVGKFKNPKSAEIIKTINQRWASFINFIAIDGYIPLKGADGEGGGPFSICACTAPVLASLFEDFEDLEGADIGGIGGLMNIENNVSTRSPHNVFYLEVEEQVIALDQNAPVDGEALLKYYNYGFWDDTEFHTGELSLKELGEPEPLTEFLEIIEPRELSKLRVIGAKVALDLYKTKLTQIVQGYSKGAKGVNEQAELKDFFDTKASKWLKVYNEKVTTWSLDSSKRQRLVSYLEHKGKTGESHPGILTGCEGNKDINQIYFDI